MKGTIIHKAVDDKSARKLASCSLSRGKGGVGTLEAVEMIITFAIATLITAANEYISFGKVVVTGLGDSGQFMLRYSPVVAARFSGVLGAMLWVQRYPETIPSIASVYCGGDGLRAAGNVWLAFGNPLRHVMLKPNYRTDLGLNRVPIL
ncbi:hypothetical protein WG66_009232 [Moniliophthora roreri]|nr:hypothetical protein WG66_009232 [Moniliophthora roreri]